MKPLVRPSVFLLSLCLLASLATACLQDPERPRNVPGAPTVGYDEENMTRYSLTVNGTFDDNVTILAWGFEVAEGSFVSNDSILVVENPPRQESGQRFDATISVQPGTQYSVRTYVSNGREKLYSKEISVKTPRTSVATLSDVVLKGSIVEVQILDDGGQSINEAGFYWGESRQDVRKNKIAAPIVDNHISLYLDTLELGKIYYIQGYAENSTGEGETYGYSRNILQVPFNEDSPARIQDEVFCRYLLSNFDGDKDGGLSYRELAAITEIDVRTDGINSIREIRNMPELKTLVCTGSDTGAGSLEELDVSKNGKLVLLNCENNKLKSLDVSHNPLLETLSCSGNHFSELDVSTCTSLKELSATKCPELKDVLVFPGQDITNFNIDKTITRISLPGSIKIPIADARFRQYLLETFDRDNDGQLTGAEASLIETLDINPEEVASIDEIRYFPNLKRLNCGLRFERSSQDSDGHIHFYNSEGKEIFSKLASLDVSKNTSLTYLSCGSNQLTSLDVTKNTALRDLSCSSNQLASLDVSKNTSLTYLSCSSNQLTSLDLSKNTALTYLSCGSNQLTSLDVSKNTALSQLSCYNNQLTSLDVSKNTALTQLSCYNNQLTSLDVTKNTALRDLSCSSNQLTSLDLSKNTALTSLTCSSNQLTSLDVSKNTALTSLHCPSNQLTSLDVSKNTALTSLTCFSNQLTSLDLSKNTALTSLYCYRNQLTSLDLSKNTALTRLDCSNNSIKFVIVWENFDPQKMERFNIGDAIAYKNNNDNSEIRIYDNAFKRYLLENFDGNGDGKISQTEALLIERIDVNTAVVESLDEIRYFTNLKFLNCSLVYDSSRTDEKGRHFFVNGNEVFSLLKRLDVSKNTALMRLDCSGNQLTNLDLSENTALTSLNCHFNQLTSLEVTKNTALTSLNCYGNLLTNFDVSKNTALTWLNCNSNQLTSLNVSKNTALTYLNCSYNQLTSLDVAKNTSLKYIYCSNDNLKFVIVWEGFSTEQLNGFSIGNAFFYVNNDDQTEIQILDDMFKQYILENYDGNRDGKLSQTEASFIEKIEVNPEDVGSIDEIRYFPNLKRLNCNLRFERYSQDSDGHIHLYRDGKEIFSKLIYLDLSKNTALTYLSCKGNQLTSLDVSKNTALTWLDCSYNQLTSLDVSKNTALTSLSCYSNQLTSLDVSNNTELKSLSCTINPLLTEIWLKEGQTISSFFYDRNTATIKYK